MEQWDEDFVVACEANALAAGSLEDVDQSTILLLEVQIGGGHSIEFIAKVVGDCDGLQEDFWHDHCAAEVEPDSVLKACDGLAEAAEVGEGGGAEVSAIELGGHVSDVGSDSHMNRQRHASFVGSHQNADITAGGSGIFGSDSGQALAQTFVAGACFRAGLSKEFGGFVSEAERAVMQSGTDIFAGVADQGQFQVVDGCGTIKGQALKDALADPVGQVGATAGLDDVSTGSGKDSVAFFVSFGEGCDQGSQVFPTKLVGESGEKVGETCPWAGQLAHLCHVDLAGPAGERFVFEGGPIQVGQVLMIHGWKSFSSVFFERSSACAGSEGLIQRL